LKPIEEISNKEQWKLWSRVAAQSFGGPAGQIAVIHKIVVDEQKLISEERFLHALNFCMLLPGPEAQQLATYMGWLMNKWRGGLLAGGLFILPGFLSILILSFLYISFSHVAWVQGLFYGMKPAVIAIVMAALYRIANRSLKNNFHRLMAVSAFVALFFFNIAFPLVVIFSAVIGVLYGKYFAHHELFSLNEKLALPPFRQTIKTCSLWLSIWVAPMILTLLFLGKDSTLHKMNLFFSKMSMVTFGGAYSALTYVAQKAVENFGWLSVTEMMDGLAMAETTPGPLIQTVQFVGFMGAFRFPDLASPYMSAFLASILTTWMTFAPCFLWIFTFAPYVEFIRGQKIFNDGLQAITASVVGVILNLSLWFLLKTLFLNSQKFSFYILQVECPVLNSIDLYAAGICAVAMVLQFKFKQGLFTILGTCTVLGMIVKLVL
jgi:chromate transporter